MSYHHHNRFREHYDQKTLSPSARILARDIANALDKDGRPFGASRDWWAKFAGLTHETTSRAIDELLTAGVFTATKKGKRSARVFALAVQCPANCSRLEEHNTPKELAAISRGVAEIAAPESPSSEVESPSSLATESPSSLATNKPLLINSSIDESNEKLVQLVKRLLVPMLETAHPKSDQVDLMEKLTKQPKTCEEHLEYILERNQVKNPKNWLASVLRNSAWKLAPTWEDLMWTAALQASEEAELPQKTAWESEIRCQCGFELARCPNDCCYYPETEKEFRDEAADYFRDLTDREEIVRSCQEWAGLRSAGYSVQITAKTIERRRQEAQEALAES